MPWEVGLRRRTEASEPDDVHLVWVVRKVTQTQAKYIRMFYGDRTLRRVSDRGADDPLEIIS